MGSRQSLRMVVACFGTVRFHGIIGVLVIWSLGWILARSMLARRGLMWAWFIHSVHDELVFGVHGERRHHTPGGG